MQHRLEPLKFTLQTEGHNSHVSSELPQYQD